VPATAEERAPERAPSWGFGDVGICLGLTLVLGSCVAALVNALDDGPLHASPPAQAWASVALLVVPWLALAGWPVWVSKRRGNGPVRDFGLTLTWAKAATGVLGGVIALALASTVAAVQERVTGHSLSSAVGNLAENTTAYSTAALAVLAALTAFGAPVVEELAFRGLAFGALVKMGQPVAMAVFWSALIFGVFHFELQRILILVVIGACLGTVRAYTGSTAASMLAHMTVNIPGAIYLLGYVHH
jgi:uncharacterized protein